MHEREEEEERKKEIEEYKACPDFQPKHLFPSNEQTDITLTNDE